MERDPPHYLKPLKTTTTPRRLIWLDCAADTTKEGGAYVDRWESACLGTTHWTSKRNVRRDTLSHFTDPQALWAVAADWCHPGKRVVLFAHDLAYQLRISQALVHLPALGFKLERIVLERTAAWASFRNDKRTLLCCDLKSWAPTHELGHGDAKTRVILLREDVLALLDWIEREQLGPFRPTGSGQSYAAYRRRFLRHKLLVHDDAERLEVERRAMWTGRCEAWRHGTQEGGPFVEYDMRAAYLTIAGECEVPAIAAGTLRRPKLPRLIQLAERYAVLAECEITTETPVVPTLLGERTAWPVGTFKTTLWDPELLLAAGVAEKITVSRAWLYRRAPAVKEFAQYVSGVMEGLPRDHGPMAQLVAKHWSRCLVGRLGLRFREWQSFGEPPEPDLRLVTYIDTDAGQATDLLIAGHEAMILTGLTESRDSLPQIPGWVMSECRRRLWNAMSEVGLENVLYVDTDSMIIDASCGRWFGAIVGTPDGARWARKAVYNDLTIHGPRNLSFGRERRVSGLPLTARQVAPLEFTGQVMRSVKESMRMGELDAVASIPRKFILDAPDLRRQHNPGGSTSPYRINTTQEVDQ